MTTTTGGSADSQSLILKTDIRGRVLTPVVRREQLLDEFERSGLSGAKFAQLSGVKYQTFADWVQRRRRERQSHATHSKPKAPQVAWLEAVVEEAQKTEPASSGALILHLPGGIRAELSSSRDIALAVALVRALDKPC